MQVVERAPGTWNPPHTHPSASFTTVLEGEVTNVQIVDGQKTEPVTYRAGDAFVEPAWGVQEAGNLGAVRALELQTRFRPKNPPAAIALPIEVLRPGAQSRVLYRATTEITNMSGPVDVYQAWLEWPPGSRAPAHFQPGVEFQLVTEGELTFTKATVATVSAGDSIVNAVGEINAVSNPTTQKAVVATTHLIAAGKPRTFPVE